MTEIKFKFNIKDNVLLVAIDQPGRILAMMVDSVGQAYQVVYWHDGTRRTDWVREWEIKNKE